MPDPFDSASGQTHYAGDGCYPFHEDPGVGPDPWDSPSGQTHSVDERKMLEDGWLVPAIKAEIARLESGGVAVRLDELEAVKAERDEAQRHVIALGEALMTAITRLAQYGAPWEDLTAAHVHASQRTIDIGALLATDPVISARVEMHIQERVRLSGG